MSKEHRQSLKHSRSSKISFRDTSEVQEYQSESAINQDEELKRGSRIIKRPDKKNSFTNIAHRIGQKFKNSNNRSKNTDQKHIHPVQVHRPTRINVHQNHISNSRSPEVLETVSPIPDVSGSPTKDLCLSGVNRKTNPVRKMKSADDLPLEIPEDNIKTLLTLGFMSSLAIDVNDSDSDDLTEAELDQLIMVEQKIEKLEKIRTTPRPIQSQTNATGKWSKIPVLCLNQPIKEQSNIVQRNLLKYRDPQVHESRKVPITNRVTKWSLDGRLIHERPTRLRHEQQEPGKLNMRPKLPDIQKPANLNKFGAETNYNENDQLGPWETKSHTNFDNKIKGLPPTPNISQKYLLGTNGMINPKSWFETGHEKQKRPKTGPDPEKKVPPRWRI